jgi:2,3-bisphosphoglycerate-dependent phosphoglycerate mutase
VELLLIRHGLPVRRELTHGPADPELSESGRRQAELLAEYLDSEPLDALYASPLRRAYETAEPLSRRQGLEIVVVDDVAELDRDSSEYVPIEELRATNDPRWTAMAATGWIDGPETTEEFQRRCVTAIEARIEQHAGGRIAIVCHGGVTIAYVASIIGLASMSMFFYPNYTSINRVAAARSGQRSILTLNETPHLRGTGLPIGLFNG